MTLRHSWPRSRLVATSRNTFLGETTDTRTYETVFGLRVRVRTICEMERVPPSLEVLEAQYKSGMLKMRQTDWFSELNTVELLRNERMRRAHYDERSGA